MPFIPIVIGWISTAIASLVAYFTAIFTAKVAIATAGALAVIAVAVLLKEALDAVMVGLLVAYPSGYWAIGLGMLPDNTNDCIAAIAIAKLAAWVYAWKTQIIGMYTRV